MTTFCSAETYEVVDDVELVVVVVLRVHLAVIALAHVVHERVAVRERLLAVNALVAKMVFV